ncbi:MAG: helix-turn-helix domain-containing protein, partial [Bacteroidota bacterium]
FYGTMARLLLANYTKGRQTTTTKKVNPGVFQRINERLQQLMEEEQVYKKPELSLELLASELSVSRHLLSQLLNENLQKGFHQYVNDYRIAEACRILKANQHYSIEAIGHEVGFNSRSSFFAAFKKKVGMTPARFRKEHLSE